MSKQKFDPAATAKKFLSNVEPEQPEVSGGEVDNKANYMPTVNERITTRRTGVDSISGESTKQIGYYVTPSQDKRLSILSVEYGQNKSYFVREALRMYFDYLDNEENK